jgi:Tol biopolymer transport system component
MAPAEWDQVFELFHAARERSGGERVLLLETACAGNTALRKAVEELLKEDEAASGFLSKPLFASFGREARATLIKAGQKFGRYTTVALIGRGGMGEVWSAYDADLDRTVALKFLSSEALLALDASQITREAKTASALNHPGIVTIHEVVQSESTFAIVMELVEGKPLRELCGNPVPLPEVAGIGRQIADALAAAHACGTVHGDIKPENILLRPDRYIKVLDFGLARRVTAEAIGFGSITALGTLRYMSPEQARGDALTPATDVFSFGLILYELITGRHAFQKASPADTARAILTEDALSPCSITPSIPSRLNSLIRTMLAKDPAARPSAMEVRRILNELEDEGEAPQHLKSKAWKWGVVAAVFVAGLFALWRWKQPRDIAEPASFRQITNLPLRSRATAAAISPDGKRAAYANINGIFFRNLRNGETKALSAPNDYVVDELAWFADGAQLVASGFSATTLVPSIWLIPANGTPSHLLRRNARAASPSPNGKWIAFVTQDWSEIWVIGANDKQPRRMVAGPARDTFPVVFWSADGRRINFERNHPADAAAPASQSAESVLLASAKVVGITPNIRMSSACALPDGHILFLQSESPGSTSPDQIWDVRTDPATGRFVSAPRKIGNLRGQSEIRMNGLSSTRDGQRLMVLRGSHQGAVFVGDFQESPPVISRLRRLTLDEATNFPHAWTPDEHAVIFESNRNGSFDLFKQNIDQRTPETIVASPPLTEMLAQLAPDRHWLLYATRDDEGGLRDFKLMRVPVQGGTPEEVPIGGPLDEFRCALGAGKRCVLRATVEGEHYIYYDLDPIRGKGRELARTKWTPGWLGNWDISPDGTRVALPDLDSHDARIRVVNLAPVPNEPAEREVVLPIPNELRGLVWAAGGNGWFVSVKTMTGYRMLYVYLDGHFLPLGDIQGWAVPSPDGRHIAVWDHTIATNVWLVERH